MAERARDKKERRVQNKLLREDSARGTPVSEGGDGRGRKKKGKAKANDYDTLPAGSKRKRGLKSETPSMIDDDDDEDNGGVCRSALPSWEITDADPRCVEAPQNEGGGEQQQ